MIKTENVKVGEIALIQQQENGRIVQIGITKAQNSMIQFFLAKISEEDALIQMPEDYDLILKSQACKKCKKL